MASNMHANSEDLKGLTVSLGELGVETSSTRHNQTVAQDDGVDDSAVQDDIWDEASDVAEWNYRQNQFQKMGYRNGITEGQKDSAQEGFNAGFRQSVHIGYKWGLVRGITSALANISDSSREKLVPNAELRGKLQDMYTSVHEISAADALQMFHKSILQSGGHPEEKLQIISDVSKGADSTRLQIFSKDLVFLLHECPKIEVNEELTRDL